MTAQIIGVFVAAAFIAGCASPLGSDRGAAFADRERQINEPLEAEIKADRVELRQLRDRLRVTLADEILFPEGGWEVTSQGKIILDRLVQGLSGPGEHHIEVHGHTDNVPVAKHLRNRFPTNWELSCARAAEVVRYLQRQGLDPARMVATGHGEYSPVESNATLRGRAANRRTEIDLVAGGGR